MRARRSNKGLLVQIISDLLLIQYEITPKPGSAQLQAIQYKPHSQRAIEVRVPKRGIQEGKEKGEERIRCRRRG